MLHRPATALLVVGFLLSTAGCATVISGRTADVAIHSHPPEANVTVRDHEGTVVARTVTPGQVKLKRGRKWLRPASYEATFEKPGYETARAPINSKFNPWAIGNLALGGGLGAGVDLATGAVWRPKSDTIERSLARLDGSGYVMPSYATDGRGTGPIQQASATDAMPNR